MDGQAHLAKLLVVEGEHARVLAIKFHLKMMLTALMVRTMISLKNKFQEIFHLDHRERVRSCEVTLASEINDHL